MKPHTTSMRRTGALMRWTLGLAAGCAAQVTIGQTVERERTADRERTVVRDADRVTTTTVETRERVKLKNPDRNFVEKVMRMSMDHVEIARVAMERTSNPKVRGLADVMAADHSMISQELAALAANKGVALPAKDRIGDKWLKRDAKDFDVEYLKRLVADHEETVKLFQKQARDGHDPELVAFARKHLSAVQQHLQVAGDLHKLMK